MRDRPCCLTRATPSCPSCGARQLICIDRWCDVWRAGGARCAAGEQIRTVAARRPGYTTSCCPGPYTVHLSFTLICRDIHPSCTSEVTQELSNRFFNFSIIILFIFLNILGEHRYPVAQNPRYTLFIKSYMNFVLRT